MGQMTMRVSGVNLESHDEAGVAKATMVNSGRLPCNFRGLLRTWITQLEYSGVRNPVPRRNIRKIWENIKTSKGKPLPSKYALFYTLPSLVVYLYII